MKKAIFVHIPKCAGCSLWKALLELNLKEIEYFGHGEAKLKKPFPYDNSYKNYFSFSFVRNPFDRLVSAFFFLQSGGHNDKNALQYDKYMRTPSESFEDFVLHKLNDDAINSVQHLKPQYFWIYKNNQQAIDYVGKTESMNKDMSKICSILNIPNLDLPHENKSSHKHYTEYYDDEMRELVAKKYAKDIEYFGYKFK